MVVAGSGRRAYRDSYAGFHADYYRDAFLHFLCFPLSFFFLYLGFHGFQFEVQVPRVRLDVRVEKISLRPHRPDLLLPDYESKLHVWFSSFPRVGGLLAPGPESKKEDFKELRCE